MTQEQLQDLAQLRGQLDRIDDQILDLIEERLALEEQGFPDIPEPIAIQ